MTSARSSGQPRQAYGDNGHTLGSHRSLVSSVGPKMHPRQATSRVHHAQCTHTSTPDHTTAILPLLPDWQSPDILSSGQRLSLPPVEVGASCLGTSQDVPQDVPQKGEASINNAVKGNLVTTFRDGKVVSYRCEYVNPLKPGNGPCGSVFHGTYGSTWRRHLSTIHGRAEHQAIRDGRLELANAVALHDPDCQEQTYTCLLDRCGWYVAKGQRWSVTSWDRLDRPRRCHVRDWH
jgi:hypothetical protein